MRYWGITSVLVRAVRLCLFDTVCYCVRRDEQEYSIKK